MLQRNFDSKAGLEEQAPRAASDQSVQPSVDLRELGRILRRRWKLVAAPPLALVAIALIYSFVFATTLYTATSTVFVDPRRATAIESNQSAIQSSNYGTDDATIDSEAQLIQSVAILERVVVRLKLTEDEEFVPAPTLLDRIRQLFRAAAPADGANPEDAKQAAAADNLRRRMKVSRQGTTFIVDINVSSESPRKAADIANAVAEAYFEEQVRAKNTATKIASSWLNRQIDELKSRVVTSEKAVEDFRSANNLKVAQGVTVNDQQITDLNNQLISARVATAEARAKYEQTLQLTKAGADPGSINAAISSDVIARLRTQYADIAKNEADLLSKYGPRHPIVANVRAQLRDTQRLINEELQRILQSTQHDFEVARSREASLQQSFDQLQGVSTTSGQAQVRLRELQREAEANRTLYESYLARYKESTAQQSLELPDSHVVARARIPIAPSWPKKFLLLGLSLTLGLGLGCMLAFLADYLDRRVKTLEQAEQITGVPSLAAIPLISSGELAGRAKLGRHQLAQHDPRSAKLLPAGLQPPLMRYAIEAPGTFFAEAVRAVRLALQRTMRTHPVKVVVVTSALDSEGKSTLAVNLAQSLAVLGLRTLLIDGDLRNPQVTRALCPRAEAGLIELASGAASAERAVLVDASTGLSVLPSTAVRDIDLITELMFSDRIVDLIDEFRQRYEMIIIDSPPLVPLVDGRALAELSDRIVLALGWDQTPSEVLAHTMDLLEPVRDRILGTVLTKVDMSRLRFYDYYQSSAYLKPYAAAPLKIGATR
ncbi:polysaccharide biosynthesis tyrosine autokinase [Rhodopseudomonas sp. NSM]|uniref:polysaccharide biosynthesis tyrosine autokinase n=1 Tax=Rhodopseudomonas sp. NSM TaxID=3457630 RepID=UPI0040359315